jgi:hypothetical protein
MNLPTDIEAYWSWLQDKWAEEMEAMEYEALELYQLELNYQAEQ